MYAGGVPNGRWLRMGLETVPTADRAGLHPAVPSKLEHRWLLSLGGSCPPDRIRREAVPGMP